MDSWWCQCLRFCSTFQRCFLKCIWQSFFICMIESMWEGDVKIDKGNSKYLFFTPFSRSKIVKFHFRLGPKPRTVRRGLFFFWGHGRSRPSSTLCAVTSNKNSLSDTLKNQTNWTGNFKPGTAQIWSANSLKSQQRTQKLINSFWA